MAGLAIDGLFGGSRFAIGAPTSSTATLSAAAALSMTGTLATVNLVTYSQGILALLLLTGAKSMRLALVDAYTCYKCNIASPNWGFMSC